MHKLIFATLAAIILSLCAAITLKAEPLKIDWANDVGIPGGRDRWLTNAFEIGYGDFTLGQEIYTPTDKRSKDLPEGDRPWDSYLYLQHTEILPVAFGEETVIKSRVGGIGDYGYGKEVQTFVHDTLTDWGRPQVHPEWVGVNPAQIAGEVIISRRSREYLQSVVGDSRLTQEYGARIGNVNDSLFLDQELRKHFFKHLDIYAGAKVEAVAFNTHLDGRMFVGDVYTVDDTNWFIASGRLGIEWKTESWGIGYEYTYKTEEFDNQDDRHIFGTIKLSYEF